MADDQGNENTLENTVDSIHLPVADDQGNENTLENTVDKWLMIRVNEYIRKYCR